MYFRSVVFASFFLFFNPIAGSCFSVLTVSKSGAGQYTSLSDALRAAASGDTIRILDGEIYSEDFPTITLNHLTLEAAAGQTPLLERSAQGPDSPPEVFRFAPSAGGGTLVLRGASPALKMTIQQSLTNQPVVGLGNPDNATDRLILENLVLAMSPSIDSHMLVLRNAGKHTLRHLNFQGRLADCHKAVLYCACSGDIVFEDCDIVADGHNVVLIYEKHSSGASGNITMNRCVLEPGPYSIHPTGISGQGGIRGNAEGRLILNDCYMSVGAGGQGTPFFEMNSPATVQFNRPVFTGEMGWCAFRVPGGGEKGPDITIAGTPRQKVDFNPFWNPNTATIAFRLATGSLRLVDCSATAPRTGWVPMVDLRGEGPLTGPVTITVDRCVWTSGAGAFLLDTSDGAGNHVASNFPIHVTATNSIWIGGGGEGALISMYSSKRTVAGSLRFNHCTVSGPTGNILVATARKEDGCLVTDELRAEFSIFNDTGTNAAGSVRLYGQGNLITNFGSILSPGVPSFLGGQPLDTIVANPQLDLMGHLTPESTAALGAATSSGMWVDVDGDPRPSGESVPDIGADEHPPLGTPTPLPPDHTFTPTPSSPPTPVMEPGVITVSKTTPAQYRTLVAAINCAFSGMVIRILDSETYAENFPEITHSSLIIEAAPGQSPTLEYLGSAPGAIIYSPASEGSLTLRGDSSRRRMTLRYNGTGNGMVIRHPLSIAVNAHLTLENLVLEIVPGRSGGFLGLFDGGNHQLRNVSFSGLTSSNRVDFYCAGSATFEDCDLRAPGHGILLAFQNHLSGAKGTLILRRCILAPHPDSREFPGIAGVRSSSGTGRLVLEDCQLSSGGGDFFYNFLTCNKWPTVEIVRPIFLGGMGLKAFEMLGGHQGGNLTIKGEGPWTKTDLDPLWQEGTSVLVQMACGKLQLQDLRTSRQGPNHVAVVTAGRSSGTMGSPLQVEMERCEWLGGSGTLDLIPSPLSDYTQSVGFTARNTIWAGERTVTDAPIKHLICAGGVAAPRPANQLQWIHCTIQGPGFDYLLAADQQYGDEIVSQYTLWDDTEVLAAANPGSPPLQGKGNLVARKGTSLAPGAMSFPGGEPEDTLVGDPLLNSQGRPALESPAIAALNIPSMPLLDVDGDSRPQPLSSERFDVGADEINETGETLRHAVLLQPGEQVQTSLSPLRYYDALTRIDSVVDGAGLVARLRPLRNTAGWTLLGERNALPTLDTARWKTTELTPRGVLEILIPSPEPGDYYFSACHTISPFTQRQPFQMEILRPDHYISKVTPDMLATGTTWDLWVHGLGLDGTVAAELRDSERDHPCLVPLQPHTPGWWHTTVDVEDATEGSKDFVVHLPDAESSLPSAVMLTPGKERRFEAYVSLPSPIRKDRLYTLRLHYANLGDTPIPAPMLTLVTLSDVDFLDSCSQNLSKRQITIYACNPQWPPDILPAHFSHVVPIQFRCNQASAHERIRFTIRTQHPSSRPIHWEYPALKVLGSDWKSYLDNIALEARRFRMACRQDMCVADLIYQILQRSAGKHEYLVAGHLVDAASGAGLPRVEMMLRENKDSADIIKFGQSNAPDGSFCFPPAPTGDYEIYATGYLLDYDWPVLIGNADLVNLTVRAIPIPPEEDTPASGKPGRIENDPAGAAAASGAAAPPPQQLPSLLAGAEGKIYLTWMEDGLARIAVHEQDAWRYVVVEAQQNTSTKELVATWAPGLAGYSPDPGLVLVRASGDDKNSRLAYSLAAWEADGSRMKLSAWQTLTSDTLADRFPCVAALPGGNALVLWLQRDESRIDDTDLYSSPVMYARVKAASPGSPAGAEPALVNSEIQTNANPAPLAEDKFTYEVNFSKGMTVPKWLPFLNGPYQYELRGRGTGVLADCERVGQGQFGSKAKIGPIFELSGDVGGSAKWKYNCDEKKFVFDSGSANGQIQGEVKLPFTYATPYVGATLVPLLRAIGMEMGVLYRILVGFGFVFREASLTTPCQGSTINVTALFGLFVRNEDSIYHAHNVFWDFQADATGGGTIKIEFERSGAKGVATGEAVLRVIIKLGKEAIRYERKWKTDTYQFLRLSSDGMEWDLEDLKTAALDGDSEETLVYEYDPIVGASDIYKEGTLVIAGAESNREMEGSPSVAVSTTGEILVAWTHEAPADSPLLGTELWVASWNGDGFDPPLVIHDARDFNAEARIVFDSDNNPFVIYRSASGAGWNPQSDPKSVIEAMLETEIYHARRIGGAWTEPVPLAIVPGADLFPSLAAGPNGQMAAVWIHRGDSPENNQVQASRWNPETSAWEEPIVLAQALRVQSPAVVYHADRPVVVWVQDADGLAETDADLRLYESRFDNDGWTLPAALVPAPISPAGGFEESTPLQATPLPEPPSAAPLYASNFSDAPSQFPEDMPGGLTDEERYAKCCEKTATPTPTPKPVETDCCKSNNRDCNCEPTNTTEVIISSDPNEKAGPAGVGASHRIPTGSVLDYTIYFENATTATAAAQEVIITDVLDPSLDPVSVRFLEVVIGKTVIAPMTPGSTLQERREWPDWLDRIYTWHGDFQASVNSETRTLVWHLRILDPYTGELPEDPHAGLLPPNDTEGRGQGHVRFLINPRAGIAQGTRVENWASIVFDTENPILTPVIFNTLEDAPPGVPANPSPSDKSSKVPIHAYLQWTGGEDTTWYEVFLWKAGQPAPDYPTAANLVVPYYQPPVPLEEETTYFWRVGAHNDLKHTDGSVWQFTTRSYKKQELWMLF